MPEERRVLVPVSKLIIVTEDYGDYVYGYCVVCSKSGYINQIEHEPDCPVPEEGGTACQHIWEQSHRCRTCGEERV